MYYSYKCTYCGREFYTYDSNKENASLTLYKNIKQHLIDYNEDHKEHEMDDGEQADSHQIYIEMKESREKPSGAYEASDNVTVKETEHKSDPASTHSTSSSTSHSSAITLILLIILLIVFGLLFLLPGVSDFMRQHLPQP